MFWSNEAINVSAGGSAQPNGTPAVANPTRAVTAGATDGAEVTLHEITAPLLIVMMGSAVGSRVSNAGAAGAITVVFRLYIDDVLIDTITHTAIGFGASNEATLFPAAFPAGVMPDTIYAPKWKVTTQVTANTLDGTSTLSYGDVAAERLKYIPVAGG